MSQEPIVFLFDDAARSVPTPAERIASKARASRRAAEARQLAEQAVTLRGAQRLLQIAKAAQEPPCEQPPSATS